MLQTAHFLGDARGAQTVVLQEFIRLAAAREFRHGQFVDANAFRGHRGGHGIAQAAIPVMVFHSDDGVIRAFAAIDQQSFVDWFDAEDVDDANQDALLLEFIVRLQGFDESDASAHDGDFVPVALAKQNGFAEIELLRVVVNHRLSWGATCG